MDERSVGHQSRPWRAVGCVVILVELAILGAVLDGVGAGPSTPSSLTHLVTAGAEAPPPRYDPRPVPPTTVATVPKAVASSVPAPAPAPGAATVVAPAPAPAPRPAPAPAGRGLLPPANPPASIPPQPNFLADCSSAVDDQSAGCTQTTLAAIDNARRAEGVGPMTLPGNWGTLSPGEQLFVATNLERTARALPPLSAMATALDQAATQGAATAEDPAPPPGFPFAQWGANWAGGVGSPLEAIYDWMYDDGPGSSNADCTPGDGAGCWGHRDKILMALSCDPCVMGAGFAPRGWDGQPSWAELLVGGAGSPALDFTWQQEAASL